jgi:hypothetical protein
MTRARGHHAFCSGVTKDGRACGNPVPTLPSGAFIRRRCRLHAGQTYEEQATRRARRATLSIKGEAT